MNKLFQIRFWLEIITLPAFVFLVIHLAGHGSMILFEEEHDHGSHAITEDHSLLENILTLESLIGVLFLLVFVWAWHQPKLKRWVPCSHDHCHTELPISHTLAIVALCLHFFPEAAVRHELIEHAAEGELGGVLGTIGFLAHFLVDVIVAIVISSYWHTKHGFILSFGIITAIWLIAFYGADSINNTFPESAEGILFLVSAFLLAMFVHKPHKPKRCKSCDCH